MSYIIFLISLLIWICSYSTYVAVDEKWDEYYDDFADLLSEARTTLNDKRDEDNINPRRKRGTAQKLDYYKWPKAIIPVYIQNRFTQRQRRIILGAIKEFEDNTCIRFKHLNDENLFDTEDRAIIMKGLGCASRVGRYGGQQEVFLTNDCIVHRKVLHQLGHLIGMHHEHTRPDRDKYIKVYTGNVDSRFHVNFNKLREDQVETFGIPYDYLSIMHYGTMEFATNNSKTITATDERYKDVIGTAHHASFRDLKLIHLLYECAKRCGNKVCPGAENYVNSDCECMCPNRSPNKPALQCSLLPSSSSVSKAGFSKNSNKQFTASTLGPITVPGVVVPSGLPIFTFVPPVIPVISATSSVMKAGFSKKSGVKYSVSTLGPINPTIAPPPIFPSFIIVSPVIRSSAISSSELNEACPTPVVPVIESPYIKPSVTQTIVASSSLTVKPEECKDKRNECYLFKGSEICNSWNEIIRACPVTCGKCKSTKQTTPSRSSTTSSVCMDHLNDCYKWKDSNLCNELTTLKQYCPVSCNICKPTNITTTTSSTTTVVTKHPACRDRKVDCPYWKMSGFCDTEDFKLMHKLCPRTCSLCECKDKFPNCLTLKKNCNDWRIKQRCMKTCNECTVKEWCRDTFMECPRWSSYGACYIKSKYYKFMAMYCRKSCQLCNGPTTSPPVTVTPEPECHDYSRKCRKYKKKCASHAYVKKNCRKTCNLCPIKVCRDYHPQCEDWSRRKCFRNDYVKKMCPKLCKRCKPKVKYCRNYHPRCRYWSVRRCWRNFYVKRMCPKMCGRCGPKVFICRNYHPMCQFWSRRSCWWNFYVRKMCPRLCRRCRPKVFFCRNHNSICKFWSKRLCSWNFYVRKMCPRMCRKCKVKGCFDRHALCKFRKRKCGWNIRMRKNCPQTCNICRPKGCFDYSLKCRQYARYCSSNSRIQKLCPKTCKKCKPTIECYDSHPKCKYYAMYCKNNADIRRQCPETCNLCKTKGCRDYSTNCMKYKKLCSSSSSAMKKCPKTCNLCTKACRDYDPTCKHINKRECIWKPKVKRICPKTCRLCGPTVTFCRDLHPKCKHFLPQCRTEASIRMRCPWTCGVCGPRVCRDQDDRCRNWSRKCKSDAAVRKKCQKTCKVCLPIVIKTTKKPITTTRKPVTFCRDLHPKCKHFLPQCGTEASIRMRCPWTCGVCGPRECRDHDVTCKHWQSKCKSDSEVRKRCPKTCRVCLPIVTETTKKTVSTTKKPVTTKPVTKTTKKTVSTTKKPVTTKPVTKTTKKTVSTTKKSVTTKPVTKTTKKTASTTKKPVITKPGCRDHSTNCNMNRKNCHRVFVWRRCRKTCNRCHTVTKTTKKTVPTTKKPVVTKPACQDYDTRCRYLSRHCMKSRSVQRKCPKTCRLCGTTVTTCKDRHSMCPRWVNLCGSQHYQRKCPKTCKRCQPTVTTCVDYDAMCGFCKSQCRWNIRIQQKCPKTCEICKSVCRDLYPTCRLQVSKCRWNPKTRKNCMKTCKLCKTPATKPTKKPVVTIPGCRDRNPNCSRNRNRCYSLFIRRRCPKTCNRCHKVTKATKKPVITKPVISCKDRNSMCPRWVRFCRNQHYQRKCPKTCKRCQPTVTSCKDHNSMCPRWVRFCRNQHYQRKCPKTCKRCQPTVTKSTKKTIYTTKKTVYTTKKPVITKPACQDYDTRCKYLSRHCMKSRSVQKKCPKTCRQCGTKVTTCKDHHSMCPRWVNLCGSQHYQRKCPKTCKRCQPTVTSCVDYDAMCGYCKSQCRWNTRIQQKCPKTCEICKSVCRDRYPTCRLQSSNCRWNPKTRKDCMKTCKLCKAPVIKTTKRPVIIKPGCRDISSSCYMNRNRCYNLFVRRRCPKTCKRCHKVIKPATNRTKRPTRRPTGCRDRSRNCRRTVSRGYCRNRLIARRLCRRSCGLC